jgi:TolB protein
MNVDGSNVQRLTDDPAEDMRPSWSPDGARIVFSRMQDENWDLYVTDIDDKNLRRLTESDNNEFCPIWSPDGSQIAYMSSPRRDSFQIRPMKTLPGHRMAPRSSSSRTVMAIGRSM